jgi:hypothetical protein
MQVKLNYINKQDFLIAYLITHVESITLANIYNGFAATRLAP